MTKTKWQIGKHTSTVVSNTKVQNTNFPSPPNIRESEDDEPEYYGGYLICESVYNIEASRLISAAPELLESLKTILSNFKSCIGGGNGEIETDKADIAKAEEAILKATNKKSKKMNKEFFMNYAEGQKNPTVKYENREEAEKEAERLAEKLGVNVTTLKAVTEKQPKDIKLRVRTYADACAALNIEPLNERLAERLGLTEDEVAARKLKTIVTALNEGWAPNWMNTSERKYDPCFYINTDNGGLAYANTLHGATYTATTIGSRLCLKTPTLAEYAGNQFKELYEVILIGKTEEIPF